MSNIAPNEIDPFSQMSREDFCKFLGDSNFTYEETTHEGYIVFEDGAKIDKFLSEKLVSISANFGGEYYQAASEIHTQ